MNFGNFFKRQPSLADMRKAAADLDAELATAQARRDDLVAGRKQVFLEGSDHAIADHFEKMAAADREVDKVQIQRDAMAERIAAAERQTAVDAINAAIAAGEAAQGRGLALQDQYVEAAQAMARLLAELREQDEAIAGANAAIGKALAAGLIEPRKLIQSPHELVEFQPENFRMPSAGPVYDRVVLPDPKFRGTFVGDGAAIWDTRHGGTAALPAPSAPREMIDAAEAE